METNPKKMSTETNERIQEIAEWMADPFDKRTALTVMETMGIKAPAFYVFLKKHRATIDYIVEQKRKEFIPKLKTASMKALADMLSKNVKALQMALEITGIYTQKSETTNLIRNETEQKAHVEALLEKLKKIQIPLDKKDSPETSSEQEN